MFKVLNSPIIKRIRHFLLALQALLIPVEEFLNTILNLYLVRPAEAVELIYRDELSWGSIRLAGAHVDVAVANHTERWDGTVTTL